MEGHNSFQGEIIATFTQIACKSIVYACLLFFRWSSCFHACPHYDTDFTKQLYFFNQPYDVLKQNVNYIFLRVFNLG